MSGGEREVVISDVIGYFGMFFIFFLVRSVGYRVIEGR